MEAEGHSKEIIKNKIREEIFVPCNLIKLAFAKKEIPERSILSDQARTSLKSLLSMYDDEYKFQKNSIYYDVQAHPENHFKAFYKLQELCESKKLKGFNCFPIRTTFIPSYMTLDAKIANFHVLKNKKLVKDKYETWGQVVDLKKKAFKNQGVDKALCFQGTIETDGVGVSIIKQNTSTNRKGSTSKTITNQQSGIKDDDLEATHIEKLSQSYLKETTGRCVLIDPGRRDLMYCMKETSTVEKKQILIFSKNNRSQRFRHFRSLRKQNHPHIVKEAEAILSNCESGSVNAEKFMDYMKTRASVKDTLYN